MARVERIEHDVTGNGEVEMAHARSLQLKAWIDKAEAERREISEKLTTIMDEHGATALVMGGTRIARIDEFDMEAITSKSDFKIKHPRLWKAFRAVTHVRKTVIT